MAKYTLPFSRDEHGSGLDRTGSELKQILAGFWFGLWILVILHGPYTYPSVSSLSLDQSNQSHSPNGKITPAVLLPLVAK